MKKVYLDYIKDILNSIDEIEEFVNEIDFKEFVKDRKTFNATIRSLEVIGEAANKVPSFIKEKYPDIPWKEMVGMRNKLIHEYFGIDEEILWETVKKDIPALKRRVLKVYKDLRASAIQRSKG